jgi:hypothetical protein
MKKLLLFFTAVIVMADITAQDATIYKLPGGVSPVIDGSVDILWQMFEKFNIDKPYQEENPTLDIATWQAVWDDTAIFIIVSVEEDNFCPPWCSDAADWQSDKVEVYLDVNETLKDGSGPAAQPNGHYQIAPGFTEGEDQYYYSGPSGLNWDYSYAYKIDGTDYVFEYAMPWNSLTDDNGTVFDPDIGRPIGFDVCVIDRDEGDVDRKRAVWMNDGKGPAENESWDNMDDCGIMAFEEMQPNDSVVCGTGKLSFVSFDVPIDSVNDYYWRNSDVGVRIDSSANYVIIKWYTPGEKNISLIITKTLDGIDTLEQKLTVYPDFSVSLGQDFTICKNTDFTIIPTTVNGVRPFNYFWNSQPGDSVYTGSITESNYLSLKIEDDVGCTAIDDIFINIPQSCFPEQICMVTVDAATGKNKIVWQKTGNMMIKEYKVLKESTVAGQYSEIGTVSFNNESVFIDYDSDPAKHSDRYRLATIDSCANTPGQSSDHQTIHLMISPGLPGNYNLSWSAYIGFDYNTYYIYKGSSTDNMILIDSIAKTKTQYTDTASRIAYYQVAVRRDEPCDISVLKSTGDIYYEATSNIVNTVSTDINNNESSETYFELFPNPVTDELVIVYSLLKPSDVEIEIYNLLGMKIHEFRRHHNNSGTFRYIVKKEFLLKTGSINIVSLKLNGKVYYKKIIIDY